MRTYPEKKDESCAFTPGGWRANSNQWCKEQAIISGHLWFHGLQCSGTKIQTGECTEQADQVLCLASEVSYLILCLSPASELKKSLSQTRYGVEDTHFCLWLRGKVAALSGGGGAGYMLQPKHNKGLEAVSGENHSQFWLGKALKKKKKKTPQKKNKQKKKPNSYLPQATEPPKSR